MPLFLLRATQAVGLLLAIAAWRTRFGWLLRRSRCRLEEVSRCLGQDRSGGRRALDGLRAKRGEELRPAQPAQWLVLGADGVQNCHEQFFFFLSE